jgi:hypothetical protein
MWCCTGDGGLMAPRSRPAGVASSRLMLRWLKTVVVSDEEKAHVMRQAGTRKTTTAEASKLFQMTSEPGRWCVLRDEPGGYPLTGQAVSGVEVA